jgi:hypothetical protein
MMKRKTGWHREFDDPIVLPNGKKLLTLKDAIEHLSKAIPKEDHNHPKVLTATEDVQLYGFSLPGSGRGSRLARVR